MAISSIFGGGSTSDRKTIPNTTGGVSQKLKEQISQELAIANATELVNKTTENCFEKCLTSPYNSGNENCVDQCLAKYMKSWNTVSKAYIARIQQASTSGEI
ncbi:hypothetical protein TPHA_0N00590 [Tetrapisispora phaffii CBS 4417]|uniref:Mitochondrial import inner membrane translocase subunit n=1 Tax=Tetrapisispora phaffii (strain ATCC 24235 / CBS 4417 / NBRC 1672 / NRRL Y-8282 / UCD 70-5) TaxID=1071381 RepID=G8C112_TETPH|nr:hypothetical protein TPHA_0N00590 [Tetrapisispora phaffii CBS 4417]CCE65840.1 hypothetical protein TPHA_0N00590 [Tetrapisispora phaffii CBS 4417]